ncbi:MAG: hypothetical protein KIT31_41350 [Deltaproteobacteria bacterium]|nr:hypothetical protein [Deltaproteobacteria bacterium]
MRRALLAAAILVGVGTSPAAADDKDKAARLFEEGRALLKAQKFDDACEKFERSFELERAAGTELNLGDCAEREGKHGRAWALYDDAARSYDRMNRGGAAKAAREKMAALSPRLATIVVRLEEPDTSGLALRIADRPAAPGAEVTMLVDPGEVEIEATAPDRETYTTTVKGTAGKTARVDVPALVRRRGKVIARTGTSGELPPRRRSRVKLAIGLGVGGGLALGGSLVFGGLALSQQQDAEAAGCRDVAGRFVCDTPEAKALADGAGAKADLATALGIGGAALLATALVVYYTAPRDGVTVTPIALLGTSPGAGAPTLGVGISARF